jgi:hypothetical protein
MALPYQYPYWPGNTAGVRGSLARGLIGAFDLRAGPPWRDGMGGSGVDFVAPLRKSTEYGVVPGFTEAGPHELRDTIGATGTRRGIATGASIDPHTIVALVRPNASGGSTRRTIASLGEQADSNASLTFGLDTSTSNGALYCSNDFTSVVSTLIAPADRWSVVGIASRGAASRTFVANGILLVDTTNVATQTVSGTTLSIGQRWSQSARLANYGWGGEIAFLGFWNRALSNAELLALCDDPFRMFRQPDAPLYLRSIPPLAPDETMAFTLRSEVGKSALRRGAALRAPNFAHYTETGRAVTAVALVTLSDIQRYKDLGLAAAALGIVATSDVEHYRDLGLAVPVAALVTAAEAQHYKDTGLPVAVSGIVSGTDAKKFAETGLSITAVGVVAESDILHAKELGLAVGAAGVVALSDVEHYRDAGLAVTIVGTSSLADVEHYRELALAVPVAGVIAAATAQHYKDLGLAVSAQVQAAITDLEHYKDLALGVTVAAVVSLATEVQHGSTPYEALSLVAVASVAVTDLQHYLEASLPVAAQAVLAGVDREHYADALQVLLAATVTAGEVAHWRDSLQALASGQVTLAEAQHYRETGLLAAAMATVTATETFRALRWGIPVIKTTATAWHSSVSVTAWRSVEAAAWRATTVEPWTGAVEAAAFPSRIEA